jgi:hypothetical protein
MALLLHALPSQAQQRTVAEATSNNTSASSNFKGSRDPRPSVLTATYNSGAGNVSKVDSHALLGPGFKGKILVDFMPWFTSSSDCSTGPAGIGGWGPTRRACNKFHLDVGYDSTSPAQIHRQMDDIASRHFDGVVITLSNAPAKMKALNLTTVRNVFADLNARCSGGVCPLQAVIMPDHMDCVAAGESSHNDDQCTLRNLEDTLCYLSQNYFEQPSYLRDQGRPIWQPFMNEVLMQRGAWQQLHEFSGNLQSNCHSLNNAYALTRNETPILDVIGATGLDYYPMADGAYYWLGALLGSQNQKQAASLNFANLQKFYKSSLASPERGREDWGAVFAKFNNVLAAWAPALKPGASPAEGGEFIDADCGRTWLRTFDLAREYLSGKPNAFIQVETWNDYDEGTEIESGIDNCVEGVTASIAGSNLTWKVDFSRRPDGSGGDDSTIDHFDVYSSSNNQDLKLIAVIPDSLQTPTRSFPLSSLKLGSFHGSLYVQAVGKPSILNHMATQPVAYPPATR